MYEADIERLVAQAQRIERLGMEVLDDAETLDENGADTSTATELGNKQTNLQDELEQTILDFEAALESSDGVGRGPKYEPGGNAFTITWDSSSETATIEYSGSIDLNNQNITVTVAGSEQSNMFSDPTSTGETETIDTSGLSSNDRISVSWVSTDYGDSKMALPNTARAPVDKANLPSNSRLVNDTTTYETELVIER